MVTTNLTIVTQLPIVKSQLREAGAKVEAKAQEVMAMVCTEETLKAVKEVRASMNKEFKEYEEKRKQVKAEIMKPYEEFDEVYKECIADKFKMADASCKEKIEAVENALKEEKKSELVNYFNEYAKVKEIDFVTFEQAKINITLSASMKSLKEEIESFLDRIESEVMIIKTQSYADEMMYEYKKTLDVSYAIRTVTERRKVLEELEKKPAVTLTTQTEMNESVELDGFVLDSRVVKQATIRIVAPVTQIKAVMDFMTQNNIKYYEVETYEHI